MVQCQPAPTRRFAAIFAGLLLFAIPQIATADGRVWAGAGLANLTSFDDGSLPGPGAQLGLGLDLSEFFALSLDATSSYHFGDADRELPADRVASAALGLRYNFDVFKYVPYAGLAAAAYLDAPAVSGSTVEANFGVKLFLGVDWRFHRFWSVGFHGELHALLTQVQDFPVYTFLGLNAAYHLRF